MDDRYQVRIAGKQSIVSAKPIKKASLMEKRKTSENWTIAGAV